MTAVLVELAGPAGAGKTTLVQALQADLSAATLVGAPTSRELAAGLAVLSPHLVLARLTARGRWWTREELRSLAYLAAWRHSVRAPAGAAVRVLDHGPVFRLASLTAFGPPMVRTAAFARMRTRLARDWGGLLDVVVWLDAPDAVLLRRIADRTQQHRIRGAGHADAVDFLARYRAAYRSVIDQVTAGGAMLLELHSASASPDRLAALVRATLLTPAGQVPR